MDRWVEELELVKHEMEWTILGFQHQADMWMEHSEREDDYLPIGHKAYAAKQQKLWKAFHKKALENFSLYI